MAVTNELTTIHSCEQATDAVTSCTLSGADSTFGTASDEYVEGSAGYIFDLDIETHSCVFTPSSSLNLTSQVVWLWMRFLTESYLGTWASGAVKCRLSDGTNYSEWYLGGAGRWGSAWNRIPFYTGSTPDAVSGTLNLGAVTVITYYFTGTVKSKLPQNVFIDFLQYGALGAGIKVTGGGVGTEEDLDDVVGDDATVAAGMIEKVDGVFYMNGPWNFGDTATNSIYFKDINEIIVSKDHYRSFTTANRTSAESLVASNHYQFNVQNYSTGTCNFELGEAAGGRGTSGCTFKTGGNRPIVFDFNDTDIDLLSIYACTFINCGTTALPTAITGSEVYDSVWNGCGEVDVSTFKFRYCNFVNATSNAIQVDSTSFDVKDCTFVGNTAGAAIEHTVNGDVGYDNLRFSGNTTDVLATANATSIDSHTTGTNNYSVGGGVTNQRRAIKFTSGSAQDLTHVFFELKKVSSPTGQAYAKLYADGATPGTLLATSNALDVSDLTASYQTITVVFPADDQYTLSATTDYWISFEYTGGDASNYVDMEGASGAAGEDSAVYAGSWATSTEDPQYNALVGVVNVSASNLADPGIWDATGTPASAVDITNTVNITLTIQDEDQVVIQNAQTSVYVLSTGVELMNEDSNASGIATEPYNYQGATDIKWRVRKSETTDNPRYFARSGTGQIGASGFELTVTLKENTFI